ncbi:MAG: GntR family transcriptional regulator [Rhodobacter sp.]|nr:GntR family transcriptional regulator [Rhodobacter sp.]
MGSEPASRTPRYAEILAILRGEVASGVFPVGATLPSEAELCQRFSVSRFTIREALRRLQSDGIVMRVQGAGSRVVRTTPASVFVQRYRSVSDLTQYAEDTHLEVQSISDVELGEGVARQIGGAAGETWCYVRALRRADVSAAEVLAVVESYVPRRFAKLAREVESISGPIYAALSSAAREPIENVEQEMQALPAPVHVAAALGLTADAPVLRIMRRYSAASGTLIASFNWHRGGDRYIHRASLSLDAG